MSELVTEDRYAAREFATNRINGWVRGYLRRHPIASLGTVGEQFVLGVRAVQYLVLDIATGRFAFREFVRQSMFMVQTSYVPTMAVAIPISATLSVQFGLLAGQVGATSPAGAASGLAVIRQAAPLVTAILLAAAVGSAIRADLGARTIREEVDAMEVMGVSVLRLLVVPRLAAGIVVAMAIVTVVACQKGLSTKGGPAGVANSVNAAVVASIILLMLVNVACTELYTILFPRTSL